jgi:CBS domain-containing protein
MEGQMCYVRQVLQGKESATWTVTPQDLAFRALELMAVKDVGALPVVEEGVLVGTFSERDYARKVALRGKSPRATTVGELMTPSVVAVSPADTVETCIKLMRERRVRHLTVMHDGHVAGLVSMGDVLQATVSEQAVLIRDLENFIVGARS